MKRQSKPGMNLGRRHFLKTGKIVIPALAVLGLALTLPTAARADCDGTCSGSCTGSCEEGCAVGCKGDCSGTCTGTCDGNSK
jgi:CXXX repeat radical SAM target protein